MEKWVVSKDILDRKNYLEEVGYDAYCLFIYEDKEVSLAKELNKNFEDILAIPILKISHKIKNGERTTIQSPLLSSYIFLFTPKNKDRRELTIKRFNYKVLGTSSDGGKLIGEDLKYAEWIKDNNGIIPLSQAILSNGLVKIVSGPLKNFEGKIIKYDKHRRNCLIEIEFLGKTTQTWLPFEFVDTII